MLLGRMHRTTERRARSACHQGLRRLRKSLSAIQHMNVDRVCTLDEMADLFNSQTIIPRRRSRSASHVSCRLSIGLCRSRSKVALRSSSLAGGCVKPLWSAEMQPLSLSARRLCGHSHFPNGSGSAEGDSSVGLAIATILEVRHDDAGVGPRADRPSWRGRAGVSRPAGRASPSHIDEPAPRRQGHTHAGAKRA